MRIVDLNPLPIAVLPFLNAGRGAGGYYEDRLPAFEARVDRLPPGVAAIVATSDLQGRERFEDSAGGALRLLGEVRPRLLQEEILPKLDLPTGRIGVLLAGDFYTVPALDRRGGTGDVTSVWEAFGEWFDWVAGVPGNHDAFGPRLEPRARFQENLHFLDAELVEIEGLRIAGLGGIIGNPAKLHRREQMDYLAELELLLAQRPDIVVLHDGPDAPELGGRGSPLVRELCECREPTLIVRGHAHWPSPLTTLANGTQVLNVDATVAVLRE
jgi:Icc-related predicted phosphoesterase